MLTLDQSEQRLLTDAVDALLSPLDFEDADAWRCTVNRKLHTLMRADISSFLLPIDGRSDAYCEQRRDVVSRYPEYIAAEEAPRLLQGRLRRLRVADREAAWGPQYQSLRRTRYWNEFARPLRLFDSMTICVPTGPESRVEHSTQLIFNHDAPERAGFTERELALGKLLMPALRAGVMTWMQFREAGPAFAISVDKLDVPMALYDSSGCTIYRNEAFFRLLEAEPQSDEVLGACRQMARNQGCLTFDEMTRSGLDASAGRVINTRFARYTLTAARLGPAVTGHQDAIAISVRRARAELPTSNEIQSRFRLTRRQAEVALLLADRKSNREIAATLSISPHTARHHTEAVMETLEVRDRRAVLQRIRS